MGTLHTLARKRQSEVYAPINLRPSETCRVMWFRPGDGNGYEDRFDAVGIQFALGEKEVEGYHVVETPDTDGPVIRYIVLRPNGTICLMERKHAGVCRLYREDEVQVVGFIFQFIRNRETGERWELIRGPGRDEELALPYYDSLETVPL